MYSRQHECMAYAFEMQEVLSIINGVFKNQGITHKLNKCLFWAMHRNTLLARLGNASRTRNLRKWMLPTNTKGIREGNVGTVCYSRFM